VGIGGGGVGEEGGGGGGEGGVNHFNEITFKGGTG